MEREEAIACARRLAALSGGPVVRRLAAVRELSTREAEESAALLAALVDEAHRGDDAPRIALAAMIAALGEEASSFSERVLEAARAQGFGAVVALFTRAAASRELDEGAAKKADARLFAESLGHLKWRARLTTNPDELARMASASEPSVVRNVLLNPRLTEEAVVRLAARRPVRAQVLEEVWRSTKWGVLRAVRRALVFNPYLPPALGTRIAALLSRGDWEELAKDPAVSQEVRSQAIRLLEEHRGASSGSEGVSS